MSGFMTLLKKESMEIIRSKKLLLLCVIFGFVAISSPVIAKAIPSIFKNINTNGIIFNIPEPTWKDAIDQLVKNMSQFGLIVIIFMFAGSISDEKSRKTLEMVMTKPVSRTDFVLAKFVASSFYISIVFLASAVVFYFYTNSLFESLNFANYTYLTLFLLVFLLTIFCVTLFFSTISKSQIMSAGLSFVISILFTTVVGYIKSISDYSPSYVISNYKDLMAGGNLHLFLPSFFASLIIIVLLLLLSVISFSRQEVER